MILQTRLLNIQNTELKHFEDIPDEGFAKFSREWNEYCAVRRVVHSFNDAMANFRFDMAQENLEAYSSHLINEKILVDGC